METAEDKGTESKYRNEEVSRNAIQEGQGRQSQPASSQGTGSGSPHDSAAGCAPSFYPEPSPVGRDQVASIAMNERTEGLQSLSSGLTQENTGQYAYDEKQKRLPTAWPQECQPGYSDLSRVNDGQTDNSSETEQVADSPITGLVPPSRIKLTQRPTSSPVETPLTERVETLPKSNPSSQQDTTWTDCATQTVIGPTTFRSGSARPTSVPDFKSKPPSRGRRNDVEYPNYPDKSFAALQSQYYPAQNHPHPLRTRSSQSSNNASYASDSSAQPREFTNIPSGAKTVGNTPSQSPGIPPSMSGGMQGSEDSAFRTPTMHPAHNFHLQEPIETHKLLKDVDPVSGRKTINEYELFEKLGSGQHGTVKLGRNKDSKVAVKIVRRFSKKIRLGKLGDPSDMIKKEVAILKKARHPHVVSLLEVIDDDEYGKVYLVLEFVERGEIVWRKKTDRDVANFEMKRVRREKAGLINEAFEREELERFNQSAPRRRLEKVRASERQKAKSTDFSTPYWSMGYGEAGGEKPAVGSKARSEAAPEATDSMSLHADLNTEFYESSLQCSTPKQQPYPKPASLDTMALETVTPESLSRHESSKEMSDLKQEDTSARPEVKVDDAHVFGGVPANESLQWRLQDFIDEQNQWTEEEEQYMHVPCLTIQQTQQAFRQTVLGLEYLHFQGIIHRDIKPANLLWTEGFQVKISDFGVSYLGKPIRRGDNDEELSEANALDPKEAIELAKTVGTPAFYAPELCDPELFDTEKNPERPRITGQVDVWALGVTLYCMIFGRLPFVDSSEMGMYEKIAREEVFIPQVRLRGVEHSDKDPETTGKRMDDIIEYEFIDDELRDLIKRLLHKDPSKRISLKEVKHHPWVLRGINDQSAWVDETDPSLQSQGKRIEISNEDVAGAVVAVTLVDRMKAGLRRLGSVVGGRSRDGRKRTESNLKTPDSPSAAPAKGIVSGQEARRTSLGGNEQIFSALRASREGSEHPLSQSVTASPEFRGNASYFDPGNGSTTKSSNNSPSESRPSMSERTLSNAESTRTVRAVVPAIQESMISPGEAFSATATPIDPESSSSLGGIFSGAGRRIFNSVRSRERGRGRGSPSQSSRSSSADTSLSITEDPHASPSLAISSTVAAGHLDQPPILREELSPAELHRAAPTSSPSQTRSQMDAPNEAFRNAQEQGFRRQIIEATATDPVPAKASLESVETPCPASPDDDLFYEQQHRATPVGVSSSSDQMASGISESFSHPSVPSVVSGASSFSATNEVEDIQRQSKEASPLSLMPRSISSNSGGPDFSLSHDTKALKAPSTDDDEAGYNGEGEMDSDSDDDILMMGPKK